MKTAYQSNISILLTLVLTLLAGTPVMLYMYGKELAFHGRYGNLSSHKFYDSVDDVGDSYNVPLQVK